jgi:hypothetical protein
MARPASKKRKKADLDPMVNFRYQDVDYQIDPERRQVYRNWVSVNTARTFLIMSAWAAANH